MKREEYEWVVKDRAAKGSFVFYNAHYHEIVCKESQINVEWNEIEWIWWACAVPSWEDDEGFKLVVKKQTNYQKH